MLSSRGSDHILELGFIKLHITLLTYLEMDTLRVEIIDATRVQEALALVAFVFNNYEPVLSALVPPEVKLGEEIFFEMKESVIQDGLSTIIIDTQTDKVVGVRLSCSSKDDTGPPPIDCERFPQCKGFISAWAHIHALWEKDRSNDVTKLELAYWIALAVHPDFGGRGIGQKLYEENIKLLKSKGFKGAYAICTSAFSSSAAEKIGAKKISFQKYATWEQDGAFPLSSIKPPHVEICIREVNF